MKQNIFYIPDYGGTGAIGCSLKFVVQKKKNNPKFKENRKEA
jgi:hypothetical protein